MMRLMLFVLQYSLDSLKNSMSIIDDKLSSCFKAPLTSSHRFFGLSQALEPFLLPHHGFVKEVEEELNVVANNENEVEVDKPLLNELLVKYYK